MSFRQAGLSGPAAAIIVRTSVARSNDVAKPGRNGLQPTAAGNDNLSAGTQYWGVRQKISDRRFCWH